MSRKKKRTCRGGTSILAVFFVSLFGILAISFASMSNVNVQMSRNHRDVAESQAAAESGLEYARYLLASYEPPPEAYSTQNTVSETQAEETFGYFADPGEDRHIVENLFTSLKPGGHLVMDLMGKEVLARIYRQYDWHKEPDGTLLLEERWVTDDWGRLEARWIIIQGEQRREHRFELRLYSASELKGLLGDAGFGQIRAFGSLDKVPYDHQAERLVIHARKG